MIEPGQPPFLFPPLPDDILRPLADFERAAEGHHVPEECGRARGDRQALSNRLGLVVREALNQHQLVVALGNKTCAYKEGQTGKHPLSLDLGESQLVSD